MFSSFLTRGIESKSNPKRNGEGKIASLEELLLILNSYSQKLLIIQRPGAVA
jgi:hypothetical protein